jgi:hypothetical protein
MVHRDYLMIVRSLIWLNPAMLVNNVHLQLRIVSTNWVKLVPMEFKNRRVHKNAILLVLWQILTSVHV